MEQETVLIAILGMMAVTYVPRALPVLVLSSRKLPQVLVRWLGYVPVAVLAAMLFPALLVPEGQAGGRQIDLGLDNLFLWAAVPTLLVAWKRRSFFGAVIVGMVVVAVARLVLGG
jgi:branched-subunit amino acid transport protein